MENNTPNTQTNRTARPSRRPAGQRTAARTHTGQHAASRTSGGHTRTHGRTAGQGAGGGTTAGSRRAPRTNNTHGRRPTGPTGGTRGGARKRKGRRRPLRKSQSMNQPMQHRSNLKDPAITTVPPLTDEDTVRIIPLGGVEEVGKNMTVVETKEDILIFDAGFQFVSSEAGAPGVDYILPNTHYLEENKDKIRGIVVTHGHLDHIGGIPFMMERLGNPPIYTRYLTSLMILKRQEEFTHLDKVDMTVVEIGERIKIGSIFITPFPVTHSIPDSMGISVETKHGNVVISGDLKLDHEDGDPTKLEKDTWGTIGKNDNILLVGDSTNAERDGFSIPEARVYKNIKDIIKETRGRLIIGAFASQFERMMEIINTCEELGKKVIVEGRSMKSNLEIAEVAGMLKVKKGTLIPIQEIGDHPADRIVMLTTGAQGEEFAVLMRAATGRHKFLNFTERDTVMLSSSVIPGNELSVQHLKDNLYRKGLKIINYRTSDVHASGHGNSGELVWIREQVGPNFFMPAYGNHSMLRCNAYAQIESGYAKEKVIISDNGTVIDIKNGTELNIHKTKVPHDIVMVDGFNVGTRQEVVLRDRESLATDGMFVVIATINPQTGKLRKSPDIISRGFVYLRESQQLLSEARMLVRKTIEADSQKMHPIDLDYIKDDITNALSTFLLQKTNKTPIVIPVLIGI